MYSMRLTRKLMGLEHASMNCFKTLGVYNVCGGFYRYVLKPEQVFL